MRTRSIAPFFVFFLCSGFCSLVDQVVWLRLAMAQFGVTAPMVSIVLSLFMAGLALGSVLAPRLARRAGGHPRALLRLYAGAELVIGLSAVVVPLGLGLGRRVIASVGADVAWGSLAHYVVAGAWVGLLLLPFCAAMGATVPLAMDAIRRLSPKQAPWSFSFLYLANVLGACLGTLVSAFVMIELLGFRATLLAAAGVNVLIALSALALARGAEPVGEAEETAVEAASAPAAAALPLLFITGLASMGMEVIWTRQFTPYLGTVVYAFALILAVYLAATFLGSVLYRRVVRRVGASAAAMAGLAAMLAVLPDIAADPRMAGAKGLLGGAARAALGIGPFCLVLGILTPMLMDRYSGGDGSRAGRAYAVNVLGCIIGPLLGGFLLLPAISERWALLVLAIPVALLGAWAMPRPFARLAWGAGACAVGVAVALLSRDHDSRFPRREVRRDYTATVVAEGEGMDRHLLVNGIGMTTLSPVTKMMAHMPLTMLGHPPQRILVICFGMGTSFRSALTWDVPVTVVELVPSVPSLFAFYHPDAPEVLRSPNAHVVIDDGRRFLERTRDRFDLVVIDPPPPPEAAGSSLLYSREIYALIRSRLAPGGILQQWIPGGDRETWAAFTGALAESFPHVRAFGSVIGDGVHVFASEGPLDVPAPEVMASRLPKAAAADLVEWGPQSDAASQFRAVVAREIPVSFLTGLSDVPALSDDRPVNEYYFVRRFNKPTKRRGDPWKFAKRASAELP